MQTKIITKIVLIAGLSFALGACSTWDDMSHRQKAAVTGAGVGGVAGAVVTGGGVLGTVGGAAIGGIVGDQIGKNSK